MKTKTFAAGLASAALLFALNAAGAMAQESSLQEAINQGAGGTVVLPAGTYSNETITVDGTLTIQGANAGKAYNDNTRTAETILDSCKFVTDSGDVLSLDGVTFSTNYSGEEDKFNQMISMSGTANVTVKNSILENTSQNEMGPVYGMISVSTAQGSKLTVENSRLKNVLKQTNDVPAIIGGGGAIELKIENNLLEPSYFALFNLSASGTFKNNTVVSSAGAALNCTDLKNLIIENNTFKNQTFGLVLGGNFTLKANTFQDLQNGARGATVWSSGTSNTIIIENNTFSLSEGLSGVRFYNNGANTGDLNGVTFTGNVFDGDGTYALLIDDQWKGTLDVSKNYWNGSAPDKSQITGTAVTCNTYYKNKEKTQEASLIETTENEKVEIIGDANTKELTLNPQILEHAAQDADPALGAKAVTVSAKTEAGKTYKKCGVKFGLTSQTEGKQAELDVPFATPEISGGTTVTYGVLLYNIPTQWQVSSTLPYALYE